MIIRLQSQGLEMNAAIDRFAQRALRNSLGRLAEHVVAVDIFLKDANGPKGGVDKQALIRVRLRSRQEVAVETHHESLYAAIRKGARRTARAVRRQLRKSQRIDKRRLAEHLSDDGAPALN